MKSLRSRLLLWVVGSALAILVVSGVALYLVARSFQIGQLDRAVMERARLLASTIEFEDDNIELGFEELDLTDFQTPKGGWYLEVWYDDESIYRSPTLGSHNLGIEPSGTDSRNLKWFDLPNGLPGRGVIARFGPEQWIEQDIAGSASRLLPAEFASGPEPQITLFVARDAAEVLTILRFLAVGLTGVGVVSVLIMAMVLTYMVNRSMRPVHRLATTMKQMNVETLDQRIEIGALPLELEPVVAQFNSLISRLQKDFEKQRAFCADVAHELRTPLAGLRTIMEVSNARPRSREEHVRHLDQCLGVVMQMHNLVERLLEIGKLESGQMELRPTLVNIDLEIERVWQEVSKDISDTDRFQVHWKLAADREITTDLAVLEIILRNLLTNAMNYVNDGGVINVETATQAGHATVLVANTGSQVATRDVDKVFDRFWRGDDSRPDTGSHFGLGLSLAQRASTTLGGTLSVTSDLQETFRVILRLPIEYPA